MGMKQTLFLHSKPLVAIDISPTYIKLMSVDTKKWLVTSYGSVTVDPQKLQESILGNGEYMAEMIKEVVSKDVVGKLPSNHVVVSIPTNRTYSRSIRIPKEAARKLDDAVRLEAEQYIPVSLADLNLSYQVIETTPEYVDALMSAAQKKVVGNVVAACEAAGLLVLMVEPSINSVARLITLTEEGHLPTVIVDIGAATTDIAVLDRQVRATASVPIGGNTFTFEISKHLGTTLENAHQLKVLSGLNMSPKQAKIRASLKQPLGQIISEVGKIMRYYNERIVENGKIEQIIIVGGGSNMPGLGDYLTNELTMPARVASPWQVLDFAKLPQPSKQFKARYITVAGLASVSPTEVGS
jgi:type IV pilus assembly protein PilM